MTGDDKQPYLAVLGIIAVVVLAVLGYNFFVDVAPEETQRQIVDVPAPRPIEQMVEEPATPPLPESRETVPAVVEPSEPTEPAFVLPELSASDQLVRDGVSALVSHPGIGNWLDTDELARKFVVFADNVAQGKVARRHVEFLAPEGGFKVIKVDEETFLLDEKGYARYDLLADIVSSFNSRRTVEFYVLLRPLFQKAYEELGYGDRQFDEAVLLAIDHLLEAPIITYPARLTRPVVMYKYVDPKLETASESHKQLIRMGPRNTRLIQAMLTELRQELDEVIGP